MGPSEKTQNAIRRSTRLPLEIPVLVTSLDPACPFSGQCNTNLVNAHGCGLILPSALATGIRVRIEVVSAKRHTTARVVVVVPLGGDPETWLVGLELDVPGNFWGIEYAPSDWKIEGKIEGKFEGKSEGKLEGKFEAKLEGELEGKIEGKIGGKIDEVPSPALGQSPPDRKPSATARPSPSRRWGLTDISAGACYLETATPFPAGTPVVLSIRTLDAECLLDGVVRVSHAKTGMGVEFTGAPAKVQQAKVRELIGQLTSNREVPKIFVGRKERLGNDRQTAANQVPAAVLDDESPDPLLELIREGGLLTAEQFLSDLQEQRLGKRRDPRIHLALPVLLTGTDGSGRPLDQRVMTVNVSRAGALLEGVHGVLRVGDIVSLARLQKKEQFRVISVGDNDSPAAGQIGVAALDPNTSFWSEVLEATAHWLEIASLREGEDDPGNVGGTRR